MAFKRYPFRGTTASVVPTAVYFLPHPGTERVLIGEAARQGPRSHPVGKTPAMYSNLRILFKNDLTKLEKDLGHSYFYEKSVSYGESSPQETSREFLHHFWQNLEGIENWDRSKTQVYIGKPAYPGREEGRYTRNIRKIFKDLGFSKPPILVYEPYALFYYCRFALAIPFSRGDGRSSSVLTVDHGGGTINSCIIQVTSAGRLKRSRPRAPQASQHGGGLLDQYLLIRAIKRQHLPPESLFQTLTERSELRMVEKEHLLLQTEAIKITLFSQAGETAEGSIDEHSIPGLPKPWKIQLSRKDVREGFLEIWSGCHSTIASTLRTSGIEKIDYIILAGGTCRTGYQKDLLIRDFSDFFVPETEFIDISHHEKPVAYGLACQPLLDSYAEGEIIEARTEESDENLANYVGRDLKVAVGTDLLGSEQKYNLGEDVVIQAGTPKQEIWDKPLEKHLSLRSKPKRVFSFAFFSEGPNLIQDLQSIDSYPERVEAEEVQIKHSRMDVLEKRIRLEMTVNSDGRSRPRFYLAPTKAPKYFEPDRGNYLLHIPDLEERPRNIKSVGEERPLHPCIAIDFGTSTTCACSIESISAKSQIEAGQPLVQSVPEMGYLGLRTQVSSADDYRSPNFILEALQLDPIVASAAEKLFRDSHYAQSVFEALKGLEQFVKSAVDVPRDKSGKEMFGRNLMAKVFDCDSALLVVSDDTNIQIAYRDLFSGLMGIRNRFAHGEVQQEEPINALLWLGIINLLLKSLRK